MLFKETLDRLRPEVETALDEIFQAVLSKQTHEQDLLLIEINGFYEKDYDTPDVKISPFLFGPGDWGYETDHTQYRFFDFYRRTIISELREDYFKDYDTNKEKQDLYDITLQMELMVYLKFWESDRMLKKLYHLSNLALGKNYDWQFEIVKDDSRNLLIRKSIRDPIKDICPKYYQLLKDIYLSQIRNAVAHSDFYITKTRLGFSNVDPTNHAPLGQIDFKTWEERFHKQILFYNGLIGRFQYFHSQYQKQQEDKEFGLEIRLTKNDGSERKDWIKFVHINRPDWMWYNNWQKYYKGK